MRQSGRRGVVRAAGGVLWRPGPAGPEVAVVHRPRYDDWTLPKGKLAPGEGWLAAALREVREETGHRAVPGADLGAVCYRPGAAGGAEGAGGDATGKRVRYWSMRALGGTFVPGPEVDRLRWLPPADAAAVLSYALDREVLARFVAGGTDA